MQSEDVFLETRRLLYSEVAKSHREATQREVREALTPNVAHAICNYHLESSQSLFGKVKRWIRRSRQTSKAGEIDSLSRRV